MTIDDFGLFYDTNAKPSNVKIFGTGEGARKFCGLAAK